MKTIDANHIPIINITAIERTFSMNERKVKALRGLDMQIEHGSFVVLMGPSGSGKTTLLNIVGGLDQPTAGSVSVAGRRLDQLGGQDLAELRRTIGFIFQSFALLPTASAYENVERGLRLSGEAPRRVGYPHPPLPRRGRADAVDRPSPVRD